MRQTMSSLTLHAVRAALKCGYEPMGSSSGGKWGWGGSQCWGGDMDSNPWGQCWGGPSTNFWEQSPGTYSPCPAGSYKPYPGEACCQCASFADSLAARRAHQDAISLLVLRSGHVRRFG